MRERYSDYLVSRHLQHFEVLYQRLNYADAARSIPITYQGLKRGIEALERNLDVHLFDIGEDGRLKPTEFADMLHGVGHRWIDDARLLERSFDVLRASGRRMISLGVVVGALGRLPRIEAFQQAHDDLVLDVVEYADDVIDEMLYDGDLDLAITAEPFDEAFTTIPLVRFTSCVWVACDHPFARREFVTLQDLDGQDVMYPGEHFRTHAYLAQAFAERGIRPRSVTYCADMMSPYMFAAQGRGVGIGIWQVAQGLEMISEVRAVPLEDGIRHAFGVSYRKDREITDDERTFIQFIMPKSILDSRFADGPAAFR